MKATFPGSVLKLTIHSIQLTMASAREKYSAQAKPLAVLASCVPEPSSGTMLLQIPQQPGWPIFTIWACNARAILAAAHKYLTGLRVFVVEDEHPIAHELEGHPKEVGAIALEPVPSVREALEVLGTLDPLPDVDSLDLKFGGATSIKVTEVAGQDRRAVHLCDGHARAEPCRQ